jgi:hypothetical protein
MKQETKIRATCLLLAAAALPLAPALAQDTQTSPPPATEPAPPPAAQAPAPEPAPPPAQPVATPLPEVTTAPAEAPAARATSARATATRSTARTVVRTPTVRTTVRAAPVVATATPVAAATAPAATAAPAPAPEVAPTAPPVPIAAEPAAGVDTVAPATAPQPNRLAALWPWLLLGALALAGLLVFALRRRRSVVRDEVYETQPETMVAPEPEVVAAPAAVAEPVAAADVGEPEIELGMEPVRAGVAGDGARVEFRLTVGNRGSAPAEDVRVSTWMLAAGSSDMERSLIEPRADAADTPPVTIGAGESRTMEAAVALPTSEVEGDALLPVVVADAAWRGSDGAEHHIRRSYAVGVPDGEELAHFDTENPSGLHEGVVAQALGEPEHA